MKKLILLCSTAIVFPTAAFAQSTGSVDFGKEIVVTLLFISIAFYGVFPIGQLVLGQAIAKVVLSIIMVPLLIMLLVSIGRRLDARAASLQP